MSRAERRADLVDDLLQEIEERAAAGESFGTMRVEDLTGSIGISRSKFYVHFERKSDLLTVWFDRFLTALEDDLTWWAVSPDFTRRDLRSSLLQLFGRYREYGGLMRACHELASQEAAVREGFELSYQRTHRALRAHIRLGQQEGWVNGDLDSGGAAVWLTSMMERGLSDIVAPARPREMEIVVEACTDIVWNTLYMVRA